MRTSDNGVELIKRHEGLVLQAYLCPAGVWTIGYGHTRGVKSTDRITPQQAEQFLREDLRSAETTILRPVRRPLRQNQFDALVSFVFNVGAGNFQSSTLLRKVNENPNNPDIRGEFGRWIYAKRVVLPGLVKRRRDEADLYFKL